MLFPLNPDFLRYVISMDNDNLLIYVRFNATIRHIRRVSERMIFNARRKLKWI